MLKRIILVMAAASLNAGLSIAGDGGVANKPVEGDKDGNVTMGGYVSTEVAARHDRSEDNDFDQGVIGGALIAANGI